MSVITIVLDVNKRTALQKGRKEAGQKAVPLPEGLTVPQREELSHWIKNPHGISQDNYFYLMMRYRNSTDPRTEVFDALADTSPESITYLLDQLAALRKARLVEAEKKELEKKQRDEEKDRLAEAAGKKLTVDNLIVEMKNDRTVHAEGLMEKYFGFSVELPKTFKDVRSYDFQRHYPEMWKRAEKEARYRHTKAREQAQKIVEERAAKVVEERDQWIREHGSERLNLILEDGMLDDSMAVYRDEMLRFHRPGWIWDNDWHDGDVEHNSIRNPTKEDLLWYRKVKESFPKCDLIYALLAPDIDDYYTETDKGEALVKETILVDKFLGKRVVLRKNRDDEAKLLQQWKEDTEALLRRSQETTEMASAMTAWLTAEHGAAKWKPTDDLYADWEKLGEELLKQVGGKEALALSRMRSWLSGKRYVITESGHDTTVEEGD